MSIKLKSLSYETLDGSEILSHLNLTIERNKKYGLVGPNGVGKSTLARIIASELAPSKGSCETQLKVQFHRQEESPPEKFKHLSGGEWAKFRLKNTISMDGDFFIFDEPTNNLDLEGILFFQQFLSSYPGGLLIISHDRKLLESVDVILELSNRGLSKYGGNWLFYEEQSFLERERQKKELENQKRSAKNSAIHRQEMLLRQEKRTRHGKAKAEKRGLSKIEVSGMKRKAQKTLSRLDKATALLQAEATLKAQNALKSVKVKPQIYAEFPDTTVENSKLVCEIRDLNFRYSDSDSLLWSEPINLVIRGPKRVMIDGKNGSGKSTLIKLLTNHPEIKGELSGEIKLGAISFSYIDQFLNFIDQNKSVLENIESVTKIGQTEIRNQLAQFLFYGEKVHQLAKNLSGGEKLRLALAKALLADPSPQLLILDEPTNNIDVNQIEFLESALKKFNGALIVVSHDESFIKNIKVDERIALIPVTT